MNNRIFKLIEEKQMTQSDFALETGISASALTQLKNKEGNLSIDNILKIKKTFTNLSLDWLILGKGNMYEQISQPQEPSLFENDNTNNCRPIDYEDKKEIFDEPKLSSEKFNLDKNIKIEEPQSIKIVEKTIDRQIKKIIVFYDDGKFEELIK